MGEIHEEAGTVKDGSACHPLPRNHLPIDNAEAAIGCLQRGNEEFAAKRYEAALVSYRQAVGQSSSTDLRAHLNISAALFQLGRWQESAMAAEKATELDCTSVKAFYRKAVALQQIRAMSAAKMAAEEALRLSPASQKLRQICHECDAALREDFRVKRTRDVEAAAARRRLSDLERAGQEKEEADRLSHHMQRTKQTSEKWVQDWEAEMQRHDYRNWPRRHSPSDSATHNHQRSPASMGSTEEQGAGGGNEYVRRRSPEEVLGISPEASADEVRRAYKRRVVSTHPDKGGSAEAFVELQEAMAAMLQRYR